MENIPQSKLCPKCGHNKSRLEFCRDKKRKDGLNSWCKSCSEESRNKWRCKYPEKENKSNRKRYAKNPEIRREEARQWTLKNPEKRKDASRRWQRKNFEKNNEDKRRWEKNHPDRVKIYRHRAYEKTVSTPEGVINWRMRGLVWYSLHKAKNGRRWQDLVGYTTEDLKRHLEKQFTEGMNWGVFMNGEIHVDHIVPMKRFHYQTAEDPEFRVCWGLNNLQPLWGKDNCSKNNRTMEEWKQYKESNEKSKAN